MGEAAGEGDYGVRLVDDEDAEEVNDARDSEEKSGRRASRGEHYNAVCSRQLIYLLG